MRLKKKIFVFIFSIFIFATLSAQDVTSELYQFYIACAKNDIKKIETYLKMNPENVNKELPSLEGTNNFSYQKFANWLISEKQIVFENEEDEKKFILNYKRYPINIVSRYGDDKTLSVLIRYGANIESVTEVGNTPIMDAVFYNNLNTLSYLLRQGANVNVKNNDGETPIFIASLKKDDKIFNELLQYDADVFFVRNDGATCLLASVESNNISIMEKLIQKGVDVNQSFKNGVTPLYRAVYKNQLEQVQILLKNKANPNICQLDEGVSPLLIASIYNYVDITKELLKYNTEIDIKANNGITPLIEASANGYLEIVKLLVKAGADINYNPSEYANALFSSVISGNLELVKFLVENGANLNYVDYHNHCVLFYNSKIHNKEIKLYLIEKEAGLYTDVIASDLYCIIVDSLIKDPEIAFNIIKNKMFYREIFNPNLNLLNSIITDPDGKQFTMFTYSCAQGYKDIVDLLYNDVDINFSPELGETALEEAIINRQYEIVDYILDGNKKISNFGSALKYAYIIKNNEIMERLLKVGADQHITIENNKDEKFPLVMFAIMDNATDCVELLAKYNADVNFSIYDEEIDLKYNLLFYAILQSKDFKIINILLDYGADMNFKITDSITVYEFVKLFVNKGQIDYRYLNILDRYR